MGNPRLLRITTVPISLHILLRGQLQFMQANNWEVLAVSANGSEVNEIKKSGIPHKCIAFTRTITPWRDVICIWGLIKVIREFDPVIIHTHTPKAGLLGMIAAWVCRVPVRLHTVAGLPLMEAKGAKRWLLKQTERLTYACATSVYPNSVGLLRFLSTTFKPFKSKFRVIGKGSSNGIDLSYLKKNESLRTLANQIRVSSQIPMGDFIFCFVGRIVKDKGLMELIMAFDELINEGKSCWLILIGHFEPDLDPLPKSIVTQIKSHPNIIHTGFQSDIRPWVLTSDALVLPSYREGFPNVLLQAGALEKPCIATNINGCNEIISHNKTGLLVPPKDTYELKSAMLKLYNNRDWGVNAGIKARTFISGNFDQDYVWREILREYQNQLAGVQKYS